MTSIVVETTIHALPQRCFDLARDVALHCRCAAHTNERLVGGVTQGLLELGDTVTFEAVHLGVRQRLTSRIVEFDRPDRFVNQMTQGVFKALRHTHEFVPVQGGTLMRDTLVWTSPLGACGLLADWLVLRRHLRNFLSRRNAGLKEVAESS